jgi:hypothetical protein
MLVLVASPPAIPVSVTVVPRSTVRVWVAVAVLPAASVVDDVTASGHRSPEPGSSRCRCRRRHSGRDAVTATSSRLAVP